jgi:hypothetical protein
MPILPNAALPGNNLAGSFGENLKSTVVSGLYGSVNQSSAGSRMNLAQQFAGGRNSQLPMPKFIYPDAAQDWRVRISLAPYSDYFYNDKNNSLLKPLINESSGSGGGSDNGFISMFGGSGKRIGVIFPYTPTLSVTHTANYESQKPMHNNYTNYFYNNSEVSAISIAGEFTVQNVQEGQYLLATIYFLRACSKMFYGSGPNSGQPPPIVFLNGYGQYYLPNVPCVLTSVQHTMPADMDYMDVPEPGLPGYNPQNQNYRMNSTRLPTQSTITVNLQPVYSRVAQSQGFDLNDFANGALVNATGVGNAGVTATKFGASKAARNVGTPPVGGFL